MMRLYTVHSVEPKVVANEQNVSGEDRIKPCRHTVFVACDEGFEYRSPAFNEKLGLVNVADGDIELPEKGIDGLTDELTIPDAIKFASYVGAPSFFGSYVGFAPVEEAAD
jgi:hypothetical protein